MRPTLSLIRREFSAYFYSPIAYVVLAVFLFVTGHLFYLSLDLLTAGGPKGISYPMELFVNGVPFWLVFVTIAPLLTMRLFAEERSTGTLEMLLTAPVRDWQVVAAKFVACYAFYVLMWLPTLLYLPILTGWSWKYADSSFADTDAASGYIAIGAFLALAVVACVAGGISNIVQRRLYPAGVLLSLAVIFAIVAALVFIPIWIGGKWWTVSCNVDPWPVVTTYIGLALAGAMFLAIGLFISSLVKSQMVAALISLFLGVMFIVGGIWKPDMDTSGNPFKILYFFTVPMHFERNFGRGLIDTRNVILYGSVALLGLFLTVRSLESRRWR
jgi:ABC-type transport system involved in multi-copper enzyme maturation permease subunit